MNATMRFLLLDQARYLSKDPGRSVRRQEATRAAAEASKAATSASGELSVARSAIAGFQAVVDAGLSADDSSGLHDIKGAWPHAKTVIATLVDTQQAAQDNLSGTTTVLSKWASDQQSRAAARDHADLQLYRQLSKLA